MENISIVVIGKNEARNLEKLFISLGKIELSNEIIYIDSASSDESVEISKKYANKTIILENSPNLCASAGRCVGTQNAKYDWILYLDGDMELEDEFAGFLNSQEFLNFDENICGFIGYYRYIYSDLSTKENVLIQPKNAIVKHFGGAVFLKKDIVLKADNWNSSVVGNEEIDLHVRIKSLGYNVFGLDKKMVTHVAKKVSNLHTLTELFFPLNKRFYGFGQVLVSQFKHKTLSKFIKTKPHSFLMLIFIVLSFVHSYFLSLLIAFFLYVSLTQKWHYNIVYLSEILRGAVGVFAYKKYIPKIEKSIDFDRSSRCADL